MAIDEQDTLLETLTAVIARSPIVVAERSARPPPPARRRLPAGFDEVDVAILDWIAAEARRTGRSLIPM